MMHMGLFSNRGKDFLKKNEIEIRLYVFFDCKEDFEKVKVLVKGVFEKAGVKSSFVHNDEAPEITLEKGKSTKSVSIVSEIIRLSLADFIKFKKDIEGVKDATLKRAEKELKKFEFVLEYVLPLKDITFSDIQKMKELDETLKKIVLNVNSEEELNKLKSELPKIATGIRLGRGKFLEQDDIYKLTLMLQAFVGV